MRQCRAAGLAGLAAVLLGARGCRRRGRTAGAAGAWTALISVLAVSRAQVQPSAVTSEDTGINITCSLPHIQRTDFIYWYRQFPGRGPAFIAFIHEGSKELHDLAGRLWVSADRRSSTLWLARPRYGDAAVYYCALNPRGVESGLRHSKNRFGRGRAGGGTVPSRPAGSAATPSTGAASPLPAPPELPLLTWNVSLALLGIPQSKGFQLRTFMSTACRDHRHLRVVPTVALF
ncbi:uncharacterized protein LOC116238951 [Phasianus colchicus]|uniref:uncharacterized protein LOC116238951 n=1 Tax=Phasianus colchicus TaxID=9054 RepID=UPI00129EEAF2|nr:uncharacterized protein LOC116238951 [Phasianus colchicus]